MHLLEKLDQLSSQSIDQPVEKVLTHKLGPELILFSQHKSVHSLEKTKVYRALKDDIMTVTYGYEYGCYSDESSGSRRHFYRAILWHLENGKNFRGILETLRNRAFVSGADIYFFPEVDIGMTRSENRNVVRDLAMELGYNYFFATSYLCLDGFDQKDPSNVPNRLGLEGNAVMSRFPLSNLRIIPLPNIHDPLKGSTKKLGCQKVLLADVTVEEHKKVTLICINLPDHTSQLQRYKYTKLIFNRLRKENLRYPILIAGDFKTSTYNCANPLQFFFSSLNKMYRGFDYIMQEHHPCPEKFFEKRLFDLLNLNGFAYEPFNEMGVGCFQGQPHELVAASANKTLLGRLIKKTLGRLNDNLSYKYDWFVGNHLIKVSQKHQAERPKVISHLFYDGCPVSSHDPILLDFEVMMETVG